MRIDEPEPLYPDDLHRIQRGNSCIAHHNILDWHLRQSDEPRRGQTILGHHVVNSQMSPDRRFRRDRMGGIQFRDRAGISG